MKKYLSAVAIAGALALAAPAAHAGLAFKVDGASTASLTSQPAGIFQGGIVCFLSNCDAEVNLAAGAVGTEFTLGGLGDSATFDFLTFSGSNSGGLNYDVSATLAFNPPPGADTTGSGGGYALLAGGFIIGGSLDWSSGVPNVVDLGNNIEVTVDFEEGIALFEDTVTTTATVTISAVPLPASAALALFGVAGFAGYRRVQKKKQAA